MNPITNPHSKVLDTTQLKVMLQYHKDIGLKHAPAYWAMVTSFNTSPESTLSWLRDAWYAQFDDAPMTGVMQIYDPEIEQEVSQVIMRARAYEITKGIQVATEMNSKLYRGWSNG